MGNKKKGILAAMALSAATILGGSAVTAAPENVTVEAMTESEQESFVQKVETPTITENAAKGELNDVQKSKLYTSEQIVNDLPEELIYVDDFDKEFTEEGRIKFIAEQLTSGRLGKIELQDDKPYNMMTSAYIYGSLSYAVQADKFNASIPDVILGMDDLCRENGVSVTAVEMQNILWGILSGMTLEEISKDYDPNVNPNIMSEERWNESNALVKSVAEYIQEHNLEAENETEIEIAE